MRNNLLRARELLDAWRAQQAGRPLPIDLHVIDALATRADAHDGQTRALLDARLAVLLDAHSPAPERTDRSGKRARAASPETPPRSALGDLLHQLADHGLTKTAPVAATPQPGAFPEMPALGEFRQTWAKVRTDSQLRQSLVQASEDAGPLNSGVLVNRAIHLMRDLSPGYLQHFVAYVDALSWLEQMQSEGILATQETQRTAVARKPARKAARKRKDA